MSVVWRIAFRNLLEHRAKSLIVGTIILIGTFVLVVGNSLMDSAAAGIRRSFIDNFTGHLVLAGVADAPVSLFGVRSTDFLNTRTPRLDGYDRLLQAVTDHPDVAAWSPQASDSATVNLAGEDGTSDRGVVLAALGDRARPLPGGVSGRRRADRGLVPETGSSGTGVVRRDRHRPRRIGRP